MGHFFSKVSLFIDKKEAAAHLILDQDFATAPIFSLKSKIISYCSKESKAKQSLLILFHRFQKEWIHFLVYQ